MRAQTFIASAVIGLAAVSVAAPMMNERAIVTIGGGGEGDHSKLNQHHSSTSAAGADVTPIPSTSEVGANATPVPTTTGTAFEVTPTPIASGPTATPTFDTGKYNPQDGQESTPNNGQWNATRYDDSDKFDNGQWHPNKTEVAGGPVSGADPSSSPLPTDGTGTVVSGGIAGGNRDHDHHCTFIFLCLDKRSLPFASWFS